MVVGTSVAVLVEKGVSVAVGMMVSVGNTPDVALAEGVVMVALGTIPVSVAVRVGSCVRDVGVGVSVGV